MLRLHTALWVGIVLTTACAQAPAVFVEPLRVVNFAPASGSICIDVNVVVRVTFSDDVVLESLNEQAVSLLDADGTIPTKLEYDKQPYTASLVPLAPLDFDRLHTVVTSKNLRGVDQGSLPVELSASFQTIARQGCVPAPECQLPSECPGTQLCSNIGRCIDECVTDKDCHEGSCSGGQCVSGATGGDPGPGGDPQSGGDPPGDPSGGDA